MGLSFSYPHLSGSFSSSRLGGMAIRGVRGDGPCLYAVLLDGLLLFDLRSVGRDVRPAAQYLSFVSPKERHQRKGDPAGRVPALRCGQPVVLDRGAVPSNSLCSLRSRRSNNAGKLEHEAGASCSAPARPMRCAPRHGQRGGEPCSGHHCARPSNRQTSPCSAVFSVPTQTLPAPLSRHSGEAGISLFAGRAQQWPDSGSPPLWPCRGAQSEGWARALQDALASCSDSLQLFERSEQSDGSEFCSATPRSSTAGGL